LARVFAERTFAICRPQIMGGAHRLFSSIMQVVAEGRADLALKLNRVREPESGFATLSAKQHS
jgi:hypothetical protein